MRDNLIPMRGRMAGEMLPEPLMARLRRQIIGQDDALEAIAPAVELFEAGLNVPGRPVGVYLLLGPTGTGKTRTVEALAEALHGSEKHVLRVDCGEFQMEHEVAKLIGAPPGYLGHRETQPMINQQKLNGVASERSGLSIVLFDEIEKAAASLGRLLLGVLDKASLKLGDNTTVNFERSLIFLTSNLGAREMMAQMRDGVGFAGVAPKDCGMESRLESIAMRAMRKRFSPEFVNRVDRTITYRPLGRESFDKILDQLLANLNRHLRSRLGEEAFGVEVTAEARAFLLDQGTSTEYGARELKRTVHRHIMQPLAGMVIRKATEASGVVRVEKARGKAELALRVRGKRKEAA